MTNKPYSMDADPSGIRELVAVTISGAIALGAQDESPAPAGHWLGEFWKIGRQADQWRTTVWAVARALNCLPSTFSDANGHVLRAAEKLTAERDELKAELERLCAQVATVGWPDAADWLERESAAVYGVCRKDHAEAAQWLRDTSTSAAPAQQAAENNAMGQAGCFLAPEKTTTPSSTVGERATYIVSVVMVQERGDGVLNTQNKLYGVRAVSVAEAHGLAIPLAQEDFPEHRFHTSCHWVLAQPAAQGIGERKDESHEDWNAHASRLKPKFQTSDYQNFFFAGWLAHHARAALAQAPAAEPLTDEQINGLRPHLSPATSMLSTYTLIEIARTTERAHGIGSRLAAAKEQP